MSATRTVGSTVTPPAVTALVRVRQVPRSEPPTDDELVTAGMSPPPMNAPPLPFDLSVPSLPCGGGAADRAVAGLGATDALARRTTPPRAERVGVALSPAIRKGGVTTAPVVQDMASPSSAPVAIPCAGQATQRFLAVCLEIIGGFRPMTHLRPLCQPARFADIAARLTAPPAINPDSRTRASACVPARTPVMARLTGAPPRTTRSAQQAPGSRIRVRRVQICEVITGVAEVAVVLGRRERAWAMALRLEHVRDRWLCTHLEVL